MPNGICVPYTFEEEFQRIRDIIDTLVGETGEPVDIRPENNIDITNVWTEIISYDIPSDKRLSLKEVSGSLIGLSAEFRIESSNDDVNWDLIRSYVCNVQQPSYSETFGSPIDILPLTPLSKVRVRARMNGGAGDNLTGKVFSSLNGYLFVYP